MPISLCDVLFSYAFRPFFLLVGFYAVLIVAVWGLFLANSGLWPAWPPAPFRHGHELIFGFGGGAIAGFLLTAIANWTGRPPVSGRPLQGLVIAWLAARLGGVLPGSAALALWSVASLLFWSGLMVLAAREVWAVRQTRNYKAPVVLAGFSIAELLFFNTAAGGPPWFRESLWAGLWLVMGMIMLIGGRIIPAFTANWLRLNRPDVPAVIPLFDRVDRVVVVMTGIAAIALVFWPVGWLTGVLALLAGVLQAVRLFRWRGWLAAREPLLWVLHLGYGWIAVGLLLLGGAALTGGAPTSGIHALTYGAIGTLVLGVAARVALGHTGRPLQTFPTMRVAFVLIILGALCRVVAGGLSGWLLWLSIALWIAAYSLFVIQYAGILLTPRQDSPGLPIIQPRGPR
ncbi:MAG: NnrS family protein [Candidatus Competibacteraceae bacterium]